MQFETLKRAVAAHAALRRRQRLQPMGGKGDKIFPPTYPGEGRGKPPPVHVLERRRIEDQDVWCALVDSVQSQANRIEEALLAAIAAGAAEIPHLLVDFSHSDLVGINAISSLEAPHRVYDAILRDSLLGGQPFPQSPLGRALAQARPSDAAAVLQASPTALVFGAWNSTGEGGGIGAKFPRVLVSEIIAVDVPVDEPQVERASVRLGDGELEVSAQAPTRAALLGDAKTAGRRTGSRIDPLGVLSKVEVFQGEGKSWDITAEAAGKKSKKVRPSEINHGNIAPSIAPLGITCSYLDHVAVLSFAGLRRLHFGPGDRTLTARAYLAALGLLGLLEQDSYGYALRSRCDLVCDGVAPIELLHADGSVETISIDRTLAQRLYRDALAAARDAGFDLARAPVMLQPQEKLITIVRRSQELALRGEGGEAEDS
jgi:CRISPR-associated protein Csb1